MAVSAPHRPCRGGQWVEAGSSAGTSREGECHWGLQSWGFSHLVPVFAAVRSQYPASPRPWVRGQWTADNLGTAFWNFSCVRSALFIFLLRKVYHEKYLSVWHFYATALEMLPFTWVSLCCTAQQLTVPGALPRVFSGCGRRRLSELPAWLASWSWDPLWSVLMDLIFRN